MKLQGNPILPKNTLPYIVQRIRTKQGRVFKGKIRDGKPAIGASRRKSWRRYARRVTIHLEYTRALSAPI